MARHAELKVPLKTLLLVMIGGYLLYIIWKNRREYFFNYASYGEGAFNEHGAPRGFSNASPYLLRSPPSNNPWHNPPFYPNLRLPSNVIGGGGRRGALMGGSQINIPNVLPPVDISERNIAPDFIHDRRVNIATRYPLNTPSTQIGVMYKIMGDHNDVHPLYGRRTDRNRWEYHTVINGSRVPVNSDRYHNDEVSTNDTVKMNGHEFRVTKYESDLQYSL